MAIVGIIDYSGQTHCMEHASTVSSYLREVHDSDLSCKCWCGKVVGRIERSYVSPRASGMKILYNRLIFVSPKRTR